MELPTSIPSVDRLLRAPAVLDTIARNGRPAARLTPLRGRVETSRRIGIAKGRFVAPLDPQADDAEVAALFLRGEP